MEAIAIVDSQLPSPTRRHKEVNPPGWPVRFALRGSRKPRSGHHTVVHIPEAEERTEGDRRGPKGWRSQGVTEGGGELKRMSFERGLKRNELNSRIRAASEPGTKQVSHSSFPVFPSVSHRNLVVPRDVAQPFDARLGGPVQRSILRSYGCSVSEKSPFCRWRPKPHGT